MTPLSVGGGAQPPPQAYCPGTLATNPAEYLRRRNVFVWPQHRISSGKSSYDRNGNYISEGRRKGARGIEKARKAFAQWVMGLMAGWKKKK